MTPDEFFDEFVRGNQRDFHANPGSVRHAFNAAVAASHIADHYYYFSQRHKPNPLFPKLNDLLGYATRATDGDFAHIRAIANVYKHLYDDDKRSEITSAGAVESILVRNEDDLDEFGSETAADGVDQSVFFVTKDQTKHDFGPTLDTVVAFWRKFLSAPPTK